MAGRIGVLEMDLVLPGVDSLKDKRRVLSSLKDRIRGKFNVSVAEVDMNDIHQRAVLAVAAVSNDGRYINALLDKVLLLVRSEHRITLARHSIEVL